MEQRKISSVIEREASACAWVSETLVMQSYCKFSRGVQAEVCPGGKVIMKIIYINKHEMSALNTEQGWGTCVVLILPLIS